MKEYITDLHFHSRFSRAVSKNMVLSEMSRWAARKGIPVITAADFTHPEWFAELNNNLVQQENGLYKLRGDAHPTQFMLTTEISCIYKKGDSARRLHHVLIAPDLETVKKINTELDKIGNLRSDGRPILGLDSKDLLQIVLDASENAMLIPAHIWTPWFSMFGSKSGFDTIEECFEDLSDHIYAVETGLSSDPPMNWRLSQLDDRSIVSFSDAHSPAKMGREATVFKLKELTYDSVLSGFKQNADTDNAIAYTIEFYPEEGRYHWDGHRNCKVVLSPEETKKHKGICPKCKKKLTVGVSYRVDELADREEGYKPVDRPPFKSLVPLQEIIAESIDVGPQSKRVEDEYNALVRAGKNEFNVLLNLTIEELKTMTQPKIAEGIKKVRSGDIHIQPGYDGEYGVVSVFSEEEQKEDASGQSQLF